MQMQWQAAPSLCISCLQEDALIAQDNKAHVAAWQAQLADMKARQAAAVAAARAAPQQAEASPEQPSWKAGASQKATPASASSRPPVPRGQPGWASGDGATAAAGLGARKRSWNDLQQQQRQVSPDAGGYRGAAGSSKTAKLGFSDVVQQQQRGSGTLSEDVSLLLGLAGNLQQQQSGGHAAAKKKKKISTKDMAARMLGIAARSADAAPAARYCLVHLQPFGRTVATAAAASKGGRGRKEQQQQAQLQQQQWQQQQHGEQQYRAPDVDQPFLTCPWGLPVASLKELLVQQLCQQGTAAQADVSSVQLLLAPQQNAAASEGSSSSSAMPAAAGVLNDQLTVGQLHDRWWGLGPELQVQYKLLNK